MKRTGHVLVLAVQPELPENIAGTRALRAATTSPASPVPRLVPSPDTATSLPKPTLARRHQLGPATETRKRHRATGQFAPGIGAASAKAKAPGHGE